MYDELKKNLKKYAKEHEKPKRYKHTLGVVSTARKLALQYGADPDKAEIAAYFHDAFRSEGNLEHGPVAADKLHELYCIDDEDILNAIRFHTTGRPGMSGLEMVVYSADAIEPSRDYPLVKTLRKFEDDGLEELTYQIMVHTREYVLSIGGYFDEHSNQAIDYFKEKLGKTEK